MDKFFQSINSVGKNDSKNEKKTHLTCLISDTITHKNSEL